MSAAALILVLALHGCGTIGGAGTVRPDLPHLPAELAAACKDPGVTLGKTVLGEFARTRQALAACARKHGGTVAFYQDIRRRLSAK